MAKTQRGAKPGRTVPGQAGGIAVVRQLGLRHMADIGSKGGRAVVRRYSTEYMSVLGTLGANATNHHLTTRQEQTVRRELAEFLA